MKIRYYIGFLAILSCNTQLKPVDKPKSVDSATTSIQTKKLDNSKYYTIQDTILIATEIIDSLLYTKNDFNSIIDSHPEFFQEFPDNPDQLYYNNEDKGEFGSEVGQDNYYILYAYFLKQRNGKVKYATQRKKLIDIYSSINSLFGSFEYGGTYFGHQSRRILGYAEYSIYLLPKSKKDIEKTYDISKQKYLYITSLRQLIDDESKIDFWTLGKKNKIKRNNELNKVVDKLQELISDNFYLRRAQEFQYEHYGYY